MMMDSEIKEDRMRSCVIAVTPYQVLSACVIRQMFSECAMDLYMVTKFVGYETVGERIKSTGYFDKVYYYDIEELRFGAKSDYRVIKYIGKQLTFLFYKKRAERIFKDNDLYDKVFFATGNSIKELLLYLRLKSNPEYYLFDDGLGTYCNLNLVMGNHQKFSLTTLIEKRVGRIETKKVLYSPELYKYLNNDNSKTIKLTGISKDVQEVGRKAFGLHKNDQIREKIVVLETINKEAMGDESSKDLEAIYDYIKDQYTKEVIFKPHPRNTANLREDRVYLNSGIIPFELYGAVQDLGEKIFIAYDSTSAVNAKILYNQEPYVILLYRIFPPYIKKYMKLYDTVFDAIKEVFSYSRLLVPETIEEFKAIICQIINNASDITDV